MITTEPNRPNQSEKTEKILRNTVASSLSHRKTVVELQKSLEAAWKEAVTECPALNRKNGTEHLPNCAAKTQLLEAQKKRRRLEALQQHTFLVFQNLTEEKNEDQIQRAEQLLKITDLQKLTEAAEEFLHKENEINKYFLKKINTTKKLTEALQQEAAEIKKMPCTNTNLNKTISRDLKLLTGLLKATEALLSPEKPK